MDYTVAIRPNGTDWTYVIRHGNRRWVAPVRIQRSSDALAAGESDVALCRLMDARRNHQPGNVDV